MPVVTRLPLDAPASCCRTLMTSIQLVNNTPVATLIELAANPAATGCVAPQVDAADRWAAAASPGAPGEGAAWPAAACIRRL
jgi:hypothetical protein